MKSFTKNMIFQVFLIFGMLHTITCYPQTIKIPEIKVSPPEEVNSLERDHIGRSIANSANNDNNIDETIKEVEDIINNNPNLPRLTRGEILDIIENITKFDNFKKSNLEKHRDSKAIMVVMPYTPPNNDNKSIEDLFTKPPITQIINAEPFKLNKRRKNTNSLSQDKKSETTKLETTTTTVKNTVRRQRPKNTYTTSTTTEITETTKPPRTRRPIRRRTTTTTKHPNHRYPEEEEKELTTKPNIIRTQKPLRRRPQTTSTTLSPEALKIINAPDLATEEDNMKEVVLKQEFLIKPTTNKPLIEEINLPLSLKNVAEDLGLEEALKPHQQSKPPSSTVEPSQDKFREPSTTSTLMPDVGNVAESLSPEMRDLLKSFGLLPDPKATLTKTPKDIYYPEKAEVSADSYIGFKPLPENGPSRNEMEALLASFGLGRNARKQKSVKNNSTNQKEVELLNFDVIPEHLKGVLGDLGLSERNGKKINYSSTKQHIFNPDTNFATEDELKRLTKLLDTVKELGRINGTATEEDLKKINMDDLKELLNSFNKNNELTQLDETKGPDPTKFDPGLLKNEIKRQTSTTSTTTTTTTISSTSITEEPKNPLLSDLEDSFGGKTEVTSSTPEITTPSKRTGFYYLVDWNTFLDIDDQKGKRVNLRFQPKVGDPKRFLSVNVP